MELKVWVDGVQRVVCGVTETTTCQEVVIALAQAIGRTGRYTLVEKWRDTERLLAPHECPVTSLNTWGQYAGDVQLILHRTGPSLTERPPSEGPVLRGPERGLHRQSLPPLAKLRHPSDRFMRRREPRRKSLTFCGAPRGLRDILGGGRTSDAEAKRQLFLEDVGNRHCLGPGSLGPGSLGPGSLGPGSLGPSLWSCRIDELVRLVGFQRGSLHVLEERLEACETQLRAWDEGRGVPGDPGGGGELVEEILRLERRLRKNTVEMEEEEFWASELQIELESERQLEERLQELRGRLQVCELEMEEKMSLVQGVEGNLEEERLQREKQETQWISEAEARAQILRAKLELKAQERQAIQLESSCRAMDRSLGQSSKRLQEMQDELELLTKELRQVNLQQFIQQTGTKVTVLPAEPSEDEVAHTSQDIDLFPLSGSLKRPVSTQLMSGHLRVLHSPLGLNPEGIYV